MSQTISDFKNGFNGGTRANRFSIKFNWPAAVEASDVNLTYHAVAAKLPEGELGSISIPYRGRVAHFAGDRDYKPWTVTIIDDTGNNESWSLFHKWSNLLNSHATNKSLDPTFAANGSNLLLKTIEVNQLSHSLGIEDQSPNTAGHGVLRKITLKHAWPSEVGQIGFDMGEGGSLVSFTVTFSYDYYDLTTIQT
jgi:hypothetical protein